MTDKLISVVIPSYNHEQYIKQAVDSVLYQSYKNLELIVIDDGSTDSSIGYLRTVTDPRFRLFEQDNSGAHNAINRGLSLARGEILTILNSDDEYHVDRLKECAADLNDGVNLVTSWITLIDKKGKVLGVKKGWNNMLPWRIETPKHGMTEIDAFTLHLLMSNFVSTTSNMVFTRKLYEAIGGMRNLRYAHDWDYLLRTVRHFRCKLIERPLLQYRTHQTNTISSNRSWMLFEICWIFAVHLKYFTNIMFPRPVDSDGLSKELNFLAKSINTQGNEKMLWMLNQYFNESEMQGVDEAAEALLDDETMRGVFIRHISY